MDYIILKLQGVPFQEWPQEARDTYSRFLQAQYIEPKPFIKPSAKARREARTEKGKKLVTNPNNRIRLLQKYRGRCWYCGDKLTIETLHIDHIIPRIKGGKSVPENILPACIICNHDKDDLYLSEYRALFPMQPKLFWGEINGFMLKKKLG